MSQNQTPRSFYDFKIFICFLFCISAFIGLVRCFSDKELFFYNSKYSTKELKRNTNLVTSIAIFLQYLFMFFTEKYIKFASFVHFAFCFRLILGIQEFIILAFIIGFIMTSWFIGSLGEEDFQANCRLVKIILKVVLYNFHILLFFGYFGYKFLDLYFKLLVCNFQNCNNLFFNIAWFIVFVWIFSFTVSFLEVIGTSVAMYFFINQEDYPSWYVLKNTTINIIHCLGTMSIGRFYIYDLKSYNFLRENVDDLESLGFFLIIVKSILYLLIDIFSAFVKELGSYKITYIALYNCSYFSGAVSVERIMFEKEYKDFFENSFLLTFNRNILAFIFLMNLFVASFNLPGLSLEFSPYLENGLVLYTIMGNILIWFTCVTVVHSICNTLHYIQVLWPEFNKSIENRLAS